MSGRCQLPELPSGIRTLTDKESDWLRGFNSNIPNKVSNCPTCGGSRQFKWWDYRTEPPTDCIYDCPCEDQLVLHRYLAYSGVEKAYQRLGWRDLSGCDPVAGNQVLGWIEGSEINIRNGLGLLLLGTKGSGKTLLSQLVFKQLLANGVQGWAVSFHSIVSNLINSWKSTESQQSFYDRCLNAPILVIDELGKELMKERMVQGEGPKKTSHSTAEFAMDMILRHRSASALPTIITSNFTLTQISQHYGDNIASLLSGSFTEVQFSGTDFRPSARARLEEEGKMGLVRPVVIG